MPKLFELIIAGAVVFGAVGCNRDLSVEEARKVADEKIAQYIERENLIGDSLTGPVVTPDPRYTAFDYVVVNRQRHLVRVLVYQDGRTELSRMIE